MAASTQLSGGPSADEQSEQSGANQNHQEQLAKARSGKKALGASDPATAREEMPLEEDRAIFERLNKELTKDLFKQTMHLLWIRDEPGPDVTRFLTTFQVSKALNHRNSVSNSR
jgi:hypothetical protein